MDISVVVPVYNVERYVEDCIKALLSQSYPSDRYEIIMVDNNSTDRSRDIVMQYPRIKLLSEKKQGDFAARNRGIAEAKGAVIAFTDSDCAPSTDWLQCIAAAMPSSGVGIVLGSLQFASDSPILSMLADYESEKAAYVFSSNTKKIYYGYTNNMAVRRALFDRLGSFPEIYRNSDVVLVQRAIDEYSCSVVCYSPAVRVCHLEISNLWNYYRKLSLYGRDSLRYGRVVRTRPLTHRERLRVLERTLRGRRYSFVKSATFFFLLFMGGICYDLARWRATWSLKQKIELS
jgi:glycosyltransferase involved in cell wall biosynthesis